MPYLYFYRNGERLLFHEVARLLDADGTMVVGSTEGTYNVNDVGIAPRQFRVAAEGDGFRLTDLSGNKTKVNDAPVETALLQEGDRIALGRFVVYYRLKLEQGFGPDDSGQTLADAFTPPPLPKALWVNAQPYEGGDTVRTDLRDKAVVGSGKGCELTLAGETVSARHLEISREEGVLRLRDLTSTNGTWLGPVRVKDIELPLGARVRVGQWDVWVAKREDARAAARPVATPGGLVTNDPVMIGLLDRINTIANSSWPVLIQGETGTGKELFARAIHERSSRSAQKYTKYNFGVGRSPENMATELFGHEKRAFTGADGAKIGILRTVDGGTILLDEIGELPLEIQPTMLRAVGEGEIQPLGAAEPVKVDVRYIAATKRDLPQAIREGRFRDDLFYRLSVIPFIIPPLRQRKGDIVLLWDHITRELSGHPSRPLSPAAREKLLNHPWPGNVRELENAVKRVILLGQRGPTVEASDIEFDPSFAAAAAPAPAAATLPPGVAGFIDTNDRTFEQIKSDALAAVMRKVGGNRTTAAKLLDVERKTLIRMLETYGLEKVGVEE